VIRVEVQEATPGAAIIRVQADQAVGGYDTSVLSNPQRVVVDIADAELSDQVPKKQAGKGSVREIRTSQYRLKPKPIVRVVVELVSVLPSQVEVAQEDLRVLVGQATVKAPPKPPPPVPAPVPEVAKPPTPEPPPPAAPAAPAAPPKPEQPPPAAALAEPAKPAAAEPAKPEEQAAEPPAEPVSIELALIELGGLLLRPGQLDIIPAVEYYYFDTRRINVSGFSILPTLIIGILETEKVQRSIVTPSLTARLGVFTDFQAEVRVPFTYIEDTRSTETMETSRSNFGLGDIEGAIYYQPIRERGWVPDVILSARGKFITGEDPFGESPTNPTPPTGTGFYSVSGTITAVKSADPAVLFASFIYTHNFDRTVRLLDTHQFESDINPGETFGYNLGVALALSIDVSLSFRFEQRFLTSTRVSSQQPGVVNGTVPGSELNVATAYGGLTWALARNVSMDLSVGVGLTEDAPDVSVYLAFPIRFDIY
jgi:hypothetical protein